MKAKHFTTERQLFLLKQICAGLVNLEADYLSDEALEELLQGIVDILTEQSQDDVWGTEGWKKYFFIEG